jgi:hypothetical protein
MCAGSRLKPSSLYNPVETTSLQPFSPFWWLTSALTLADLPTCLNSWYPRIQWFFRISFPSTILIFLWICGEVYPNLRLTQHHFIAFSRHPKNLAGESSPSPKGVIVLTSRKTPEVPFSLKVKSHCLLGLEFWLLYIIIRCLFFS